MAEATFLRADGKPGLISLALIISLAFLLCSHRLPHSYGYLDSERSRLIPERFDHQRDHRLRLLDGDGEVKIDVIGDDCSINATICLDQSVFRRRSTCCADVCVNTRSDVLNCGTCGVKCAAGLVCCKGSCVNLLSDNRHCGKCKHRCPDADCELGLCGYGS